MERKHGEVWCAAGVFAAAALFVAWCSASRFVDNIDEGIYLDGGLRIARGEMPYRDFFTYLAPGTFVWLGVLFRCFGEWLAVARVPVVLDLALMTALVFVLVSRLAGRRAGAVIAGCFLAFETFNPNFVVTNHRWDSAAFALAAVCCGFLLLERRSHRWACGAGICAGLAAWMTFSFGLLCVVIGAWPLCDRTVRGYAKAYAAGLGAVFLAGVSWLEWNHALLPMIQGVVWSARNYAGPNRTGYGYLVGGYEDLFRNAGAIEAVLMGVLLVVATLPATMPLVCLVGWPWRLCSHPERRIRFLLVCSASILAATWPRPDMTHLMYIAALPYVLTSVLLMRIMRRRMRLALATVLVMVAGCDAGMAVYRRITEPWLETRVGAVHGKPEDLAVLRTIQAQVSSDQTLFVFPYWPVFYFTTGAHNPTRYSYLQPGMFPQQDADEVLRTLASHPPDAVIYRSIATAAYLRIWPSSDPSRLRMPEIEQFLHARYRPAASVGKFQVLRPPVVIR